MVCYGYRSCQNCTQIAISDDESPVICDGGMSCGFSVGIDLDDKLYCGGTRSCYHTTIDDINDQLWCHGTASCLQSDMEPDDDVYCLADQSCKDTLIAGGDVMYGYGAYSMYNSIVDSESTSDISVRLYGYMSGYNLTYICQSGATCALECAPDACLGTNFICNDGVSVCDVNVTQLIAFGGSLNGVGLSGDGLNFTDITGIDIAPIARDNDIICSSGNAGVGVCENDASCEGSVSIDGYQTLCCSGNDACRDATSIIVDNDVICNGHSGCRSIGMITAGDKVLCTASSACEESTILNASMTICSGYEGCYLSTIMNVDKLICTGYQSCDFVKVFGVSLIYLAGIYYICFSS